jgi:DNA (cytosine-5)-methyltransferase 1
MGSLDRSLQDRKVGKRKVKILDLYCGVGGASFGYYLAGFEVIGVDIKPQPNYLFPFIQADAIEYVTQHYNEFDAIHASPPCQAYSVMSLNKSTHLDLYIPTRNILDMTEKPYVIENVIGAPYKTKYILCGSMFDLVVRRHRNFEVNWPIQTTLKCDHEKQGRAITVTGIGGSKPTKHSWKGVKKEWPIYMTIPWGLPEEVTQSIPPAYSEYIGNQLKSYLTKP